MVDSLADQASTELEALATSFCSGLEISSSRLRSRDCSRATAELRVGLPTLGGDHDLVPMFLPPIRPDFQGTLAFQALSPRKLLKILRSYSKLE